MSVLTLPRRMEHRARADGEPEEVVRDLMTRIDAGTSLLRAASGLDCPSGCGRCCLSPEVETSELELRPLARAMWLDGSAVGWIARLESSEERRCVLYEADPLDAARGRCARYELRPGVCRLFGFSARRDRHGARTLAACKVHKEHDPAAVARAAAAIAGGLDVPEMSGLSTALSGLDTADATRQLPINEALKRALMRTGLELRLAREEALAEADALLPEPPEERPPRPQSPRRAA